MSTASTGSGGQLRQTRASSARSVVSALAWYVQSEPAVREWIWTWPSVVTDTCTSTRSPAGMTSGAWMVSSSTTGRRTSSPARTASSTKAAPGRITEPRTVWSASHGCERSESAPDSTISPEPAMSDFAPSSPWSIAARPTVDTSPRAELPSSQNRSLANGYVGSSTWRTPVGKTALQSTSTPETWAPAKARRNCVCPPDCLRNVPTTAISVSMAVAVCSTAVVSTGCGLSSTNARKPSVSSADTAPAKSTGSRRLANQYSASMVDPSTGPPATEL